MKREGSGGGGEGLGRGKAEMPAVRWKGDRKVRGQRSEEGQQLWLHKEAIC